MAKADVQQMDMAWLPQIGRAIQRAVKVAGFSNKEAAALCGVDAAEFGKWLSGERRPHFDRLFAVVDLQQPLVIALAKMVGVVAELQLKLSA